MSCSILPYKALSVVYQYWFVALSARLYKAAKRLWFRKKLKRAAVSQADLLYYSRAVIRPVLEYGIPVLQANSRSNWTPSSETACQIILSDRTYSDACSVLGLPSLHVRRQELCQKTS